MGRPSLGAAARKIQGRVKITQAEETDLVVAYGSVGRGLRALIDQWYSMHHSHIPVVVTAQEPSSIARIVAHEMQQPTAEEKIEDAGARLAPVHRHKRDHVVRQEWDSGMRIDVWACACGQELK